MKNMNLNSTESLKSILRAKNVVCIRQKAHHASHAGALYFLRV